MTVKQNFFIDYSHNLFLIRCKVIYKFSFCQFYLQKTKKFYQNTNKKDSKNILRCKYSFV